MLWLPSCAKNGVRSYLHYPFLSCPANRAKISLSGLWGTSIRNTSVNWEPEGFDYVLTLVKSPIEMSPLIDALDPSRVTVSIFKYKYPCKAMLKLVI